MRHLGPLAAALCAAFISCSTEPAGNIASLPPIFPDYAGVTVPANIAPMNFRLDNDAEAAVQFSVDRDRDHAVFFGNDHDDRITVFAHTDPGTVTGSQILM